MQLALTANPKHLDAGAASHTVCIPSLETSGLSRALPTNLPKHPMKNKTARLNYFGHDASPAKSLDSQIWYSGHCAVPPLT